MKKTVGIITNDGTWPDIPDKLKAYDIFEEGNPSSVALAVEGDEFKSVILSNNIDPNREFTQLRDLNKWFYEELDSYVFTAVTVYSMLAANLSGLRVGYDVYIAGGKSDVRDMIKELRNTIKLAGLLNRVDPNINAFENEIAKAVSPDLVDPNRFSDYKYPAPFQVFKQTLVPLTVSSTETGISGNIIKSQEQYAVNNLLSKYDVINIPSSTRLRTYHSSFIVDLKPHSHTPDTVFGMGEYFERRKFQYKSGMYVWKDIVIESITSKKFGANIDSEIIQSPRHSDTIYSDGTHTDVEMEELIAQVDLLTGELLTSWDTV